MIRKHLQMLKNGIWKGGDYKAVIGDFQMKGTQTTESVEIPNNLFEEIEKYIRQYSWEEDYYFIRFYYAFDGENKTVEFMVNNINLEEEQELLKQLDWKLTEEFYSVRHFMILKRE